MADVTTPLLPAPQELPPPTRYLVRDHPIFLRACHSPWPFIPQATLIWARGIIVVYLTALAPVLFSIVLGRRRTHSPWLVAFDFSIMSYMLLWLYHVIVFTWANTHCRWAEIDEDDTTWRARVLRAMSPPVQRPGDRKRFWYSLFYTTAQVLALVDALVYWAVLVPQGYGYALFLGRDPVAAVVVELISESWTQSFWEFNLWGVTVLIVLVEVMFLNNVKRQVPVLGHALGVTAFLALYLGWGAIGKRVTGRSPYFFLDPDLVGCPWRLALHSVAFIALGPLVFALLYGVIAVRERATRQGAASSA